MEDDVPLAKICYRRRDVEPHRANVLLVFAVLAFFGLGAILGPIVMWLAGRDLRKIAAGRMDPAGEVSTWRARDVACGAIWLWLGPSVLIGFALIVHLFVFLAEP